MRETRNLPPPAELLAGLHCCCRCRDAAAADNKEEGEEPAQEVLGEMTVEEKVQHKIDVEIQTELLDRIYTKTRQRIREKKGMITHEDAMKLVLKQDLQQIKEDMFNAHSDDFAKNVDPIVAEKIRSKDPKEREEGLRILDMMIKDMESAD